MTDPNDAHGPTIDGQWYPAITRMDRWDIRQRWLCWLGWHYFLPAERTDTFYGAWPKCVCGRCGLSGYWIGDVSVLHIQHGYWKQAGLPVPEWTRSGR